MNKKQIDVVSKGSEIGMTSKGAPRQVKYLLSITYSDGTEMSVMADGPCVAYLPDGFLVCSNGRCQFYDVGGQLIADKDMSKFGECVEIALLNGLYIFDKFGDGDRDAMKFVYGQNRFVIDVNGDVVQVPEPMIGWPIEQLYFDSESDAEGVQLSCDEGVEPVPTSLAALRGVVEKISKE